MHEINLGIRCFHACNFACFDLQFRSKVAPRLIFALVVYGDLARNQTNLNNRYCSKENARYYSDCVPMKKNVDRVARNMAYNAET